MGNCLTIDCEPSTLQDILDVDKNQVHQVHLKREIPPVVNFHLKVHNH